MVDGTATSAPEEVRKELERMLASPEFAASDRNRRFLRHVVEEKLSGRGDRIKAYSIATSVFGRSDDFDPLQDSIVRIEAARLRRAIERFYLLQAEWPGLRILIPKGTYVPEFLTSHRQGDMATPDAGCGEAAPDHGPRILVEPCAQEGDRASVARVLTRQVIAALTRFTELSVHGHVAGAPEAGHRGGEEAATDYRISATLILSCDMLRAEFLMQRVSDGRFIWAQEFQRALDQDRDASQLFDLAAGIAGEVARTVASRDGILDSQARECGASGCFVAYRKLLDFHDYWRRLDPARFEPLRRDLEATVAEDPRAASALASLSLLYSSAARFGYRVEAAPLEHALDLARQAVRLAPTSSRCHHARAVAEWFLGRPQAAMATLQLARTLNPNDHEVQAELGLRHALRMEWDSAVPLLEGVYRRNPEYAGQCRIGLFLYHFSEGRHDRALQEAQAIAAPGLAHMHLAVATALAGLGRMTEARLSLDQAERLVPGIRLRLDEDLAFRHAHPALIEAIGRAIAAIGDGREPGRLGPQGLAS